MLRKKLLSVLVLMVVAAGTVFAAEQVEKKINLEHAKCPVSGGKVNADASVDYGKGKLFFCCENCPQAYAKDKDKFTAKANMQLVVTKQVKQTACPISGGPVDDKVVSKVADHCQVKFCCENCQKKVDDAEGNAKLEAVFSKDAFKKGFAFPEENDEKKDAA